MSVELVFHPEVKEEVDEAYRWYERQRPGLGADFMAALEAVCTQLRRAPRAHQLVYRDVRRALPRRFPYGVFYRVLDDRIEVIAIQHCRRDPARWQSRA